MDIIPVTGFPLASVTVIDWICWVTRLPLASKKDINWYFMGPWLLDKWWLARRFINSSVFERSVKLKVVNGLPLGSTKH